MSSFNIEYAAFSPVCLELSEYISYHENTRFAEDMNGDAVKELFIGIDTGDGNSGDGFAADEPGETQTTTTVS